MKIPLLPTLLTLSNLLCGWIALTLATTGDVATDAGRAALAASGAVLFLAILFDGLDGLVARLLCQTSEFGKTLDSLCDAVSFGVVPAVLLMKMTTFFWPGLPLAPLSLGGLWVVCVMLRLARFASDRPTLAETPNCFTGLPSPAAAALLAAIAVGLWQPDHWRPTFVLGRGLPALGLIVALLMVSGFRYPRLSGLTKSRTNLTMLGMGGCLAALALPFYAVVLPAACLLYIVGPPLAVVLRRMYCPAAESNSI